MVCRGWENFWLVLFNFIFFILYYLLLFFVFYDKLFRIYESVCFFIRKNFNVIFGILISYYEFYSLNFFYMGLLKTWYVVFGDYVFVFEEVIRR